MNDRLEDLIRRSADEQGQRYRPTADIAARVMQRRRQRAARRLTAAGIGIAAIVGVVGFAATRNTGSTDIDVAASTSPVAPAATTLAPAPSTAATTEAVTAGASTSSPPTSTIPATAPTTNPPPSTAPPLHPDTPPAYAAAGGAVWPYGQFWNVPQLGQENRVRGTGCGSTGEIGDVIPDGLFAGLVTGHDANNVSIDVVCVYDVPDATALPAGATIIAGAPGYVVVNNSTRPRTMPMDQDIVLRLGVRDAADNCVDGTTTTQWSAIPADRQVWVRIHQGRVTWVFADCQPR
jgi:hypothetical protein